MVFVALGVAYGSVKQVAAAEVALAIFGGAMTSDAAKGVAWHLQLHRWCRELRRTTQIYSLVCQLCAALPQTM